MSGLERRRELSKLTKAQLIDRLHSVEVRTATALEQDNALDEFTASHAERVMTLRYSFHAISGLLGIDAVIGDRS